LRFSYWPRYRVADDPAVQLEMVKILAAAAGSRGHGGRAGHRPGERRPGPALPELEHMHIHKTGALIRASVGLGARCANALAAETLTHLDHYAECIGLAFQVVDDVLDQESSTATLGKTAGKDAANKKPTYVSLLGLPRAKALAEELRREARDAVAEMGVGASRLLELADFIVLRKF
jgi:farnesyl diphosphate synthase